ncbi:MAG: SMC family ATPase, partial [Pseudomonadota bacterium]
MKPLRLTMQAFGPYAQRQFLDFEPLATRPFFLIHGPTGAGKTTILDAMCYALYGETSGGERQGDQMKSDYNAADSAAEVTFDFRLGEKAYRVTRSPEQLRPRKRGDGTTKTPQKATLWELSCTGADANEQVLESQWNRVTKRVEDLLGFRCGQFRQVVMLPQGQFRALLVSNSKEREEILEKLFHTEVYRQIEAALKDASRGIEKTVEILRQKQTNVLEQAQVDGEEQLAEQHAGIAADIDEIVRALGTLQEQELAKQEALTAGRLVKQKIDEQKDAQKNLAALESRHKEVEADKKLHARAVSAAGLADVKSILEKRITESRNAENARSAALKKNDGAEVEKQKSDKALQTGLGREPEREQARKALERLQGMVSGVQELINARKAFTQQQDKAAKSGKELSAVNVKKEETSAALKAAGEQLSKMAEAAAAAAGLQVQVKDAEGRCKKADDLIRARKEYTGVRAEVEKGERALEKIKKEITEHT